MFLTFFERKRKRYTVHIYIIAATLMAQNCDATADSTLGLSMFASSFNNAPTKNTKQTIPNGYRKTSMILYGQSGFSNNTRLLTIKAEVLGLQRKEYAINGYTFSQIENSGVRSVEITGAQYLFTAKGGWKTFISAGYNSKGFEEKTELKFALPNPEYVGGLTLLKTQQFKDSTLSPILTGILQISERPVYQININQIYGTGYRAVEIFGAAIFPLRQNINLKIFSKVKNYRFSNNAPLLFQNESKIALGLIFKNPKHHSIELSIYHDNVIQEKGISIGYLYYFKGSKTNSVTKTVTNLQKRYAAKENESQKNTKSPANKDKKEMRDMIRETLKEMGY